MRKVIIIRILVINLTILPASLSLSQTSVEKQAKEIEFKVITWYRDFHENPELSNREYRTSEIVANHLEVLGLEVHRNIAHTGVVGILRGVQEGAIVALRADMDALPIEEKVNIPYASKVKTNYEGEEVGVMHACGHDAHMACLMGAAEVLTHMKSQLKGTVIFIFQPAEEGAPEGEEGGAELMIKQGIFNELLPEAIFALHTDGRFDAGTLAVRPMGMLAAIDDLVITVKGKQTHAAFPWDGIDPIVVASQIAIALQLIPSRQLDMTIAPSLVTIGSINGGIRGNSIIPDEVVMEGTIRTLDTNIQREFHQKIKNTVQKIAESSNTSAEIKITNELPVTYNDPELLTQMRNSLIKVVGEEKLLVPPVEMGGDDFPFLTQNSKGLYFYLGVRTPKKDIVPQHSPYYYVDENSLIVGVKALTYLAIDYLN